MATRLGHFESCFHSSETSETPGQQQQSSFRSGNRTYQDAAHHIKVRWPSRHLMDAIQCPWPFSLLIFIPWCTSLTFRRSSLCDLLHASRFSAKGKCMNLLFGYVDWHCNTHRFLVRFSYLILGPSDCDTGVLLSPGRLLQFASAYTRRLFRAAGNSVHRACKTMRSQAGVCRGLGMSDYWLKFHGM